MNTISYVEERIGLLRRQEVRSEKWWAEYHYISGMLDVYAREGKRSDDEIAESWRAFGWYVCSILEIAPYFRCLDIVQGNDVALANYKTDFYKIDMQSLVENPDRPFIWIVRKLGTHLYWLHDAKHRADSEKNVTSVMGTFGDGLGMYLYTPTDMKLTQLTFGYWKQEYPEIMEAAGLDIDLPE